MGVMFTHAMIGSNLSEVPDYKFIPSSLRAFDKMKFVLEQTLYLDYLGATCGGSMLLRDLLSTIRSYRNILPSKPEGHDAQKEFLYDYGMGVIRAMMDAFDEHRRPKTTINYQYIKQIFSVLPEQKYYNSLYTATMTEDFLDMYLYTTGRLDFKDRSDLEPSMSNTVLYVPNVKTCKGGDTEQVAPDVHTCIQLQSALHAPLRSTADELAYQFYSPEMGEKKLGVMYLLQQFDLKNISVDELIPVLAAFAIDHSKYVMTVAGHIPDPLLSDVCYDIVTGSSFVNRDSAGKNRIPRPVVNALNAIIDMIKTGHLGVVKDTELFGELLTKIGEHQDIVNYFTKPITKISATEALAFRTSVYADIVSDRFSPGCESMEEEEDNSKVQPEIDPSKMLLELAKPSEPMSDYIYRETVSRRISNLLKSPPENAMPNDLLMLKRWRSRWLYLASISCLRDFLTRVSLRLSA